jgi:GalNAc-alpha-(1->4)-GalNAc-alpha-(1->3)-diNAcBac-PP-undecaprenol alpha-1,4-N-acetyl-D-galactosaminyltransferase
MASSICFIGAGLQGGGQERAFTSLANHYASQGIIVSIILLFKTDHFYTLNPLIRLIEPNLLREKHNRYIYALRTIPYLRRSIKLVNPDTMISYGEWFNPFVILATYGLKYPLFITDRMNPDLKFGFPLDTAKKWLYKKATGIVAQTSYAASVIQNRTGAKNIKVIPNPLVTHEFPAMEKTNSVVTLGRLSKEKGHRVLIEAFALTKDHQWKLKIIGDGDQRNDLEKLVKDLGISDQVIFYGHLKSFGEILATSKIFVLPSFSEGFPNALIEAMAVPLACISSDCIAGPADIIEHMKNGVLVPPGSSEKLAAAIKSLMLNGELRESLASEAVAIRSTLHFDFIAKKYLNFISQH